MKSIAFVALLVAPLYVQAKLAEHVIMFGVDGLRADQLVNANTPNMDRMMLEGSYSLEGRVPIQANSGPGWSAFFCAMDPASTGFTSNSWQQKWDPIALGYRKPEIDCVEPLFNGAQNDGRWYRGSIDHGPSGAECLPWSNSTYTADFYPAAGLDDFGGNACRNPCPGQCCNAPAPWCYTRSGFEYCDIPICGELKTTTADTIPRDQGPPGSGKCEEGGVGGAEPDLLHEEGDHKLGQSVPTAPEPWIQRISPVTGDQRALPCVVPHAKMVAPDARVAAYYGWDTVMTLINSDYTNVTVDVDGYCPGHIEGYAACDKKLIDNAVSEIEENQPELLLIFFEALDGFGHGNGWGSRPYLDEVELMDEYLGRIFDSLETAGIADSTQIYLSADHAGVGFGHGGQTDEHQFVPVLAWGAGIKANHEMQMLAKNVDLGASAVYSLGWPVSGYWDGRPLVDAFVEE